MNKEKKYFYSSYKWTKTRNQFVKTTFGNCDICYKKGFLKTGKDVHHINFLTQEDYKEFYNKNLSEKTRDKMFGFQNLVFLCRTHHDKIHGRLKVNKQVFDKNGRLIKKEREAL